MSILDFMLITITAIIVVMVFMKKGLQQLLGWLIIDLIIVLLHMLFDMIRWQTIPLYIMSIIILSYYLSLQVDLDKMRKFSCNFFLVLMVVILLASSFTVVAFEIPELQAPKGSYTVGTLVFNISDKDHLETYSEIPGERDLRIQVWYPGEETNAPYAKWMIDGAKSTAALAEVFGLPSFTSSHLNEVNSHSHKDIAVSDVRDNYPVILLSHGWSSFRNLHLYHAEALASAGYIVIGIDHTYASLITRLADGRIATINKSAIEEEKILEGGKVLVDVFTKDISLVIQTLNEVNEDHKILKTKLDLDNLGFLGHSTGAAAQINYAFNNSIKAIFSLDPWVEPIDIKQLDEPLEVFRSDEWADQPNDEHLKQLVDQVYQIEGSKHVDFTMFYEIAPFFSWIGKATGDYREIQVAYITEFFNEHLKEMPNQELDYDMVKIINIK